MFIGLFVYFDINCNVFVEKNCIKSKEKRKLLKKYKWYFYEYDFFFIIVLLDGRGGINLNF